MYLKVISVGRPWQPFSRDICGVLGQPVSLISIVHVEVGLGDEAGLGIELVKLLPSDVFRNKARKKLKCEYEKTIKTAVHVDGKIIILDPIAYSINYSIKDSPMTSSVQFHSERSQ